MGKDARGSGCGVFAKSGFPPIDILELFAFLCMPEGLYTFGAHGIFLLTLAVFVSYNSFPVYDFSCMLGYVYAWGACY